MTTDPPAAVAVRIYGRVQGVGFRYWTAKTARGLGLTGWVRNEADGSVSAEFFGTEQAVTEMLQRCESGPEHAKVTNIVTKIVSKTERNFDGIGGAAPYEEFVIER